MNNSNLSRWLTRLAWGVIGLDIFLSLIMGYLPTTSLLIMYAYIAILILTSLAAGIGLIVRYRRFFRTWRGWAASVLVLTLSNWVTSGVLPMPYVSIRFVFLMLFLVSVCGFVLATTFLLWHRDVGLRLIAWGLVLITWVLAIAWRIHGNLIELGFQTLLHPYNPSALIWLQPLMLVAFSVLPLGFISFVGHTIRLIIREWG